MKTKAFGRPFPLLPALNFLACMLFAGPVRAQSWDYNYLVTRFVDPGTGYIVSEIDNFYAADTFGNPLFTNALPVYVGLNPDISNPFWLDPGFSLQITNRPGLGIAVGTSQTLGGLTILGGAKGTIQTNKHAGVSTVITAADPGAEFSYRPQGDPNQFGAWKPVHVGDKFDPGCLRFRKGSVSWTGCEVTLDPLPGGEFSSVFAILGGGTNWPGLSTPAFFADKQWDLAYIGNSDNPFDGTGFGTATVFCLNDAFMSVATPELYVGCVPEPGAPGLFGLGVSSFLSACHFRRKKNRITPPNKKLRESPRQCRLLSPGLQSHEELSPEAWHLGK